MTRPMIRESRALSRIKEHAVGSERAAATCAIPHVQLAPRNPTNDTNAWPDYLYAITTNMTTTDSYLKQSRRLLGLNTSDTPRVHNRSMGCLF